MSLARQLGLRVEKDTLLERLPLELRERIYQRAYRCDISMQYEPKGNSTNAKLVFTRDPYRHTLYLPAYINTGNINAMLANITDGEGCEIDINGYDTIRYDCLTDQVEIFVGNSTIEFPLCIEFIELLQSIVRLSS